MPNSRPLILVGGGGHARVVLDALLLEGRQVLGFTDPDPGRRELLGIQRLGDDAILKGIEPRSVRLVNGIGSVKGAGLRKSVFERLKAMGFEFASVVHRSAVVARDVEVGEGVQIMAGAVVQSGTRLGANVILNTRSGVDHDCLLGDHVHVAPGATLSGQVSLGEGVHVGTGASLIQGVTVGAGSVVGAGAVVIGDVPAGVVVVGAPARPVQGSIKTH